MYQISIRNKKKQTNFNRNKNVNYVINNECEEYGYVKKLLGNCRVQVLCNSGVEAIGIIRGSLRKFNKRVLIEQGDIVVVSKRDYQDNKVDIVHKFNIDQCMSLIKTKTISDILINHYNNKATITDNCPHTEKTNMNNDDYITFDDISISDEEVSSNKDDDNKNIDYDD
jgi:translation initiation factor 1A